MALAQVGGARTYKIVQQLGGILLKISTDVNEGRGGILQGEYDKVYVELLNGLFVNPKDPPKQFRDWWYLGIPMDNQIMDTVMPTIFTEVLLSRCCLLLCLA